MSDSTAPPSPDRKDKRVVILFGPGRSGTSSVAGSMSLAGIQVPEPAVGATESNPRGHFEPRWVVGFHKDLLTKASVSNMDQAPDALARADEVAQRPRFRQPLAEWLEELLDQHDQVIIKDPRTVMVGKLWIDTCHELGVTPSFITMLRHPAEVLGSRNTYYGQTDDAAAIRRAAIRQVAGWINVALEAEHVTRGHARVFVDYMSLLADWRAQLTRAGRELDLRFDPPISDAPHPIDDFLDPTLRRVQVDWDDLGVPLELQQLGQRVWEAFEPVAAGSEADPEVFDGIRADYQTYFRDAQTLTDTFARRGQRDARRKLRAELAKAETEEAVAKNVSSTPSIAARIRRRVRGR